MSKPMLTRYWLIALSLLPIIHAGCGGSREANMGPPIRISVGSEVREVPLERYVMGVLEKEVHADWPIEALKAQAVATRSYALYRKENPRHAKFDVYDSTADQVFKEQSHYHASIVRAVRETNGETLLSESQVLQAFFHSCCGGHSERADQVWPEIRNSPLLRSRTDPYCSACPSSHWNLELSEDELVEIFEKGNQDLTPPLEFFVKERAMSGRVLTLEIKAANKKVKMPGTNFRTLVGPTRLKSTIFKIEHSDDVFHFSGQGSGHGVGLCQWGTKGMAEAGKTYRQILEFYYPNATLKGGSKKPNLPEETPAPTETQPGETLPNLLESLDLDHHPE